MKHRKTLFKTFCKIYCDDIFLSKKLRDSL